MEITKEETPAGGRYVIRHDGGEHSELTWKDQCGDVIVADHTYVPSSQRGGGIAAKLVERLIADAREDGLKIVPACSYVAVQFRRHPDWADLKA